MTKVIGLIQPNWGMNSTGGTMSIGIVLSDLDGGPAIGGPSFNVSFLISGHNLRDEVFNGAKVAVADFGFDLVKLIFPDFMILTQ